MAISMDNAKKLEWLWRDENRCEWIETFIKIADKSGTLVPFRLTPEQREFLMGLDHKNLILKSRQLGLSSVVIAESIRQVCTRDNCTCALISHKQESCNAIFQKLKEQFNTLPEWLKPKQTTNNRQALTFANGSSIVCVTAAREILRGSTCTGIVHLSEAAFYKDLEGNLKSLAQACSESSTLILETTANGFNKFSELYFQAKSGNNDFRYKFFNWIDGRTLFQKQYDMAVEKWLAKHNGQLLEEKDYDEEEKKLVELGATVEQLIWRRSKIAIEGIDAFHVEFPATDDECFISTGCNVFNTDKISKLLKNKFKEPIKEDKLVINNILRPWIKNGSLKVFKTPVKGMRYWIGVDVSEGVGQDSSTLFILDKNGENVATFKNNKIKPYEFADICASIGKYYNNAQLVVEKASGGHSVIERLRYEHRYRNMAKYKTYDEFNKIQWKYGFDTNQKTKGIAVNDAREWFDKGMIRINDKEVLNEMKVFVIDENGKMGAVIGAHDDLVSAMWLAIQGCKSGLWYL